MKIVIFGGSGFIGSRITRHAISANHQVTVVSRSPSVSSPANYVKGDVYDPQTYSHLLKDADAVVHSIGTFFPSQDYKRLVSEPLTLSTPLKLLKSRLEGHNPMAGGFEKINTRSAAIVADALAKAQLGSSKQAPAFVYISAASSCLTSAEYIESKRRAEQLIADHKNLRSVLLRPGIVYDPASPPQLSVRDLASAGISLLEKVGRAPPRTSVNTLAAAVLEACEYPEIEGVVSHEALDAFSLM